MAHQRDLDTAEALESDLKRLSGQRRDRSWSRSSAMAYFGLLRSRCDTEVILVYDTEAVLLYYGM